MEFLGTIETHELPSDEVQKILGVHTVVGTIQHYGKRYYFRAGDACRNGTTGARLNPGCAVYFQPDGDWATYVSWTKVT